MANWLGKYWPLRLGLWLFAAVLGFAIWPQLVWEALHRFRCDLNPHFAFEWYTYFGNPILLNVRGIEAWDWKKDKRWRVPVPASPFEPRVEVIRDGRTLAIATIARGRGIVLIDVEPPHQERVYPLSTELEDAELVTVDPQMRFAVLDEILVVELATGQVVDIKTNVDVYALGSGEVALRERPLTTPTQGVSAEQYTCWKVAGNGKLVAIEKAPVVAEVEGDSPEATVVSPNGRFQAAQAYNTRMVVRDLWNHRVLENLPTSNWFLGHIVFSADSKYLLVGSPFTNLRVFDLETEALVADDQRLEHRWWRSIILMVISAIPLMLALALAIGSLSFDRMTWDYLLATVFFESFTAALALHDDSFPRGNAITGALMAIGVYWAFGPQSFWKRLIGGTVAIAVLFGVLSRVVVWVNQNDFVNRDLMLALLLSLSVATICAIAAWLMTLASGWRIAGEEADSSSGRFQFGIGAICVAIAVAAIVFATAGRFAEVGPSHLFSPQLIVVVTLLMAIVLLLAMATVWLMLWLWFRRSAPPALLWGVTSVALVSVLVASLVQVETANVVRWTDLTVRPPLSYQLLVFVGPLVTQYAWFSLALCLARRHGYRWVKATQPSANVASPLGSAT